MTTKLLFSTSETALALGISLSTLYRMIGSGELRTIKLGERRMVPVKALDELVARLEAKAQAEAASEAA